MEDDIDIYEDLPNFEPKSDENFVGNKEKDTTGGEQVELEKRIIELTTKLEDFQKVNENLKMNLISLLKTAKAEIARKDTVIDDLRRKLENAAFRRGVYSKTNRGIAQSSTVRNNTINNYKVSNDPGLSFRENEHEGPTWNSWHRRVKEQQRESTVTSITVFGERLRKRMMDEHHLEKEENNSDSIVTATTSTTTVTTTTVATINTATSTTITTNNNSSSSSSSGLNSNNNNNNNYDDNDNNNNNNNNNNNSNSNSSISSNNKEGTEKYIGESDKENGSFVNKNYCNGKSVEPGTIVRYTNSGCSKSAATISRSRKNSELEDKGETVEKSKGTSVIGMKGIGKRTREETRVSDPVKRRKLEEGKRSMESTRKDSKRNVSELSEKMGDAPEYASSVIESSDSIKEKRHILKIWDTGYVSGNDSTRKAKKQEKGERRCPKIVSEASHGKSITNGRIEMRRNESGEKFVLDSDERNASNRCLEILKKYNRRNNVEHRRIKEREDRYAACGVDHRSFRSREAVSYARCQEGKYGANERTRHTGYGDKFGKCHDYRGIGTDKSKTVHEQSYGPRDTKELSSLDRIPIDRKTNGSKQITRYVGYERRRSRGSTDGVGKQERGRENECNEQDPRRRIKTERSSRERVNEREIWRRFDKASDRCVVARIERIDDTDNERIKYRKKSNDRLSDLEEGELENSQERNDKRKGCVNREVIEELFDPSNVCSSRPMERDGQIKMEKNDSGRFQVNESVENLENIEKFIRELASDDLNRERTRVTASKTNTETETETIASKQPNLDEKMLVTSEQYIEKKLGIDDDDDVRKYVAEKHEKKEKEELSASKIVCSNIIESENVLGNECFVKQATRLEADKVSSNRLRLNIVDSSNNIQAANGTTEGTSLPRARTDRSLENIAEDDLLLVLSNESPNSRFLIDPLKSSEKPTIDEDKNTIDIGHSNGIRDNDIEQRINRNDFVNRVNTETNGKEEKERTEESKEPINLPSRRRENASANSKLATLNVHGNVVVFVRRKKPVCLADNTANMTVIVNDKKHECNKPVDSSDRVSGNDATLRRNSVSQTPTLETANG